MYILRTVPHYRLHIKIQEKSGAGGGNRTIRAYSFYVTYCKHTNARTAKPAVCPPPMYKIMYNNSKAECVVGLLTPGCAPPLPVYLPDGNVSRSEPDRTHSCTVVSQT